MKKKTTTDDQILFDIDYDMFIPHLTETEKYACGSIKPRDKEI